MNLPDLANFRQMHDIAFIIYLWYDMAVFKEHGKEYGINRK